MSLDCLLDSWQKNIGVINRQFATFLKRMELKQEMDILRDSILLMNIILTRLIQKIKLIFLGLLFADGCNLKERNVVCIELVKTDSAILEKFAEVTENNRPLYDYNHKNGQTSTKLSFTSKYFCEILDKLGCVPRKSLVLQFPDYLDKSLLRHFLRGYFDGDGSITLYRSKSTINRQASVVSSKDFIESLKEKINQINPNIHYITRSTGNGSSLVLCRKDSVKEFLSYIYEDCSIYLERKFLRYQELINK